jgi:hypothetical protein
VPEASIVVIRSLSECEAVIESGLRSFFEVGNALADIQDNHLYEDAGFDGFIAYLDSKPWGISQAHARRQIEAAKVVEIIAPNGSNMPNERQIRELAPLLRRATRTSTTRSTRFRQARVPAWLN